MRKIILSLTGILLLLFPAIHAAIPSAPIIITTKDVSLVFTVGDNARLYQTYLGEKLAADADYKNLPSGHEAYITSSTDNLFEPAIRVIHGDGNASLDLIYSGNDVTKVGDNVSIT